MFHLLGVLVKRAWFVWLIAWMGLFAYLFVNAPPWQRMLQDREFGFLPADAPTRQGQELLRRAFPNEKQNSDIVVMASRDERLREEDRNFIKDVMRPALAKLAEDEGGFAEERTIDSAGRVPLIALLRTLEDPGIGALLVSKDRQATVVVLALTSELLEERNWPLIARVETLIEKWRTQAPTGLRLDLIGSAVVGRDVMLGHRISTTSTEWWTVIIVIAILLGIYRAPLLALIPLASTALATEMARLLLAHLAEADAVILFEGIEIYITVVLYGTGVDYCLFLIARYQEEREAGADWGDALARAVGHVGPALAASAATVVFGMGMMVFAKFGKFHHAGIAVSISLIVSLCVVLTFTTSLLRLVGRWAFWPRRIEPIVATPQAEGRLGWLSWNGLARALLRHPVAIWLLSVIVLAPLAYVGFMHAEDVDYDILRRLPREAPSVVGTKELERHFPAGIVGPITVLIEHPSLDFRVRDGKGQIETAVLTNRLQARHQDLQLADVLSWSRPLGFGWAAVRAIEAPADELERGQQAALRYFVSQEGELAGHVTRLQLTTHVPPLSNEGIAALNRIEETLRAELYGDLRHANIYFLGVTADMRDLRRVTTGDQTRVEIFVVGCILGILILALRRGVVSVYLIASVLFSYFATLGASHLFFAWYDPLFVGLDWKVPIFLFTILMAVGEDYNIFLMMRANEEQAKHGPLEGIRIALVRTGRIITSCGIIMAGTLAALAAGPMQDLQHFGFALAFGVLLDTFVVRPILAPAFLIMLERGQQLVLQLDQREPPKMATLQDDGYVDRGGL